MKINGGKLQETVQGIVKASRKASSDTRPIFIKAENSKLIFYFNGEEVSVETTVEVEGKGAFELATSVTELDKKVPIAPHDEDVTILYENETLFVKWAKNSFVEIETLPETSPLIEVPEVVDAVVWNPGALHIIARNFTPFTAIPKSPIAEQNAVVRGVNFEKDEVGEVYLRATTGYRAIEAKISDIDWFDDLNLAIDSAALNSLSSALSSTTEIGVGVNANESLLVFEAGNTKAVVRTLKGSFPEALTKAYTKLGDEISMCQFSERKQVIRYANAVKVLHPNQQKVRFIREDNKTFIRVKGLNQKMGVLVEGEEFDFACNADYIQMACSLFESEEVTFLFSAQNGPITIVSEENPDLRALVAQMTLD